MLIVSRDIGSRPLGVILTARRAVFIWGDTEVMVPWRIVPLPVSGVARRSLSGVDIPFLSSIVTVSFAHFMRNL